MQVAPSFVCIVRFNAVTLYSMKDKKKAYTFRFSTHTNNNLSKLASAYHMDRTQVLEYLISVYSAMWVDGTEPEWKNPAIIEEDAQEVLDDRTN